MTITVLGKLADTKSYENRDGYRVLRRIMDWSPKVQQDFLRRGFEAGDDFLLKCPCRASGQYRMEIVYLLSAILDNTEDYPMEPIKVEYPERAERIIPLNTRTIEEFHSGADETQPVAVVVAGSDAWSVQKAAELIAAAPRLYEALDSLVAEVHRNDVSGSAGDLAVVRAAEDAIAAACGGHVQRAQAVKP